MATTKVIPEVIDLNQASSTTGLKMPSKNTAYSGPTVAEGMMRNEVGQTSQSSASCMQHFNGADWKNFDNLPNSYDIDYMLAAGGGWANWGGGGGGSVTQTSTYGGSSTPISTSGGVTYTITVGDGGSGDYSLDPSAQPGELSSISGSGLTTITAAGGGQGGSSQGANISQTGGNGGTGGGGGIQTTSQSTFQGGTGSNGGNGGTGQYIATPLNGGGGGGAGGGNGGSSTSAAFGGDGETTTIITTTMATANSVGEVDSGNIYFGGGGGGAAGAARGRAGQEAQRARRRGACRGQRAAHGRRGGPWRDGVRHPRALLAYRAHRPLQPGVDRCWRGEGGRGDGGSQPAGLRARLRDAARSGHRGRGRAARGGRATTQPRLHSPHA